MAVEAVRAALQGIEDAFAAARRERLRLIRALGAQAAPPELLEALLRREAADADTAAPLADRVARVAAERARALAADAEAVAAIDATYARALEQARTLAASVPGAVGEALTTYVGALSALHAEGTAAVPAFERADAALASHLAALS